MGGNALGLVIELMAANVGAGDPRARSAPPDECPAGEPSTCVFTFFAVNLGAFDKLNFPNGRSRRENVAHMVESMFKDNGSARIVGERKWRAKQRSEQHGGLLFSQGSIAAFQEEAAARNVPFPTVKVVEVSMKQIAVAGK